MICEDAGCASIATVAISGPYGTKRFCAACARLYLAAASICGWTVEWRELLATRAAR